MLVSRNIMEALIIVQARTGSTRLPKKMILPFFEGKGVLEITLERLINKFSNEGLVLATTESDKDDVLENIASELGVKVYRGSEEDVLSRFIETAEKYESDHIIRVCADNPFLDINSVSKLIDELTEGKYDYISYKVNSKPSILTHFGIWAEGVKLDTLKKVNELTNEKLYLEHVTNYIHTGNPEKFNIKLIEAGSVFEENPDMRLTLDTKDDFDLQKEIYGKLYSMNSEIRFEDIVSLLNENIYMKEIMKKQIEENEKK